MLVRAALIDHEAQLQNFTPLRDRLVASGQDANAKYREIQSERDRLLAESKKLASTTSPSPIRTPPGNPASLPIAPLTFPGPGPGPSLGYSGSVQMGPAKEGVDEIPAGASGSLDTMPDGLLANGSILFTGEVVTSSRAAVWLHNWQWLIAFPAPTVLSVFTYSFAVGVRVSLFGSQGSATFLSFVSLGETGNYSGQQIGVNNDGFPLVTNLASPTCGGWMANGALNVNRSFAVGAGDIPAIALVIGVTTALSPDSGILFSNDQNCFICPAASVDPATALGPMAERGIVNFHYQPQPVIR